MFKTEHENIELIPNKLYVKPEYLIHPDISGNKYRKLKYNLIEAKKQGYNTLLTFGGAYSNHLAAVAAAGKEFNFKTIGVVRGDELANQITKNATLNFAEKCGMQFYFISRELYRNKNNSDFIKTLQTKFGLFYLLPEGGTNNLAVKGCEEILTASDNKFNYICCPVGTGGTISGIVNSSKGHQKVLGFSALKGNFLKAEISTFVKQDNWQLITDYHFGGYAKINTDLIAFINRFKKEYKIPLDSVYTGKMFFGILEMLKKNYFESDAKILVIHTGGLQGILGMNELLKKKEMPLID